MIRVYHNLLKNHASVEKKRDISKRIPLPGDVMSIVDLSGTYCAAYKNSDNSRFNILSAIVSFGLALTSMDKENKDAIGVITPYAAQAAGSSTAFVDMVVKPIPLKVRVLDPLPPARNKSCQPHDSRCNNKYKNNCINLFFPSQ